MKIVILIAILLIAMTLIIALTTCQISSMYSRIEEENERDR